jgi:hypothetical protein
MASVSLYGKANIQETASLIKQGVINSGVSCELIDSSERNVSSGKVILLVFEKYYMRSSNRASLSVMLIQDGDTVYVDAVSSGGGQGALFRFSWGAEESFVGVIPTILRGKGFS